MTPLEVIEILGRPQKEVTFQSQSKWTYADPTVIFEGGRVKEVRFYEVVWRPEPGHVGCYHRSQTWRPGRASREHPRESTRPTDGRR